MVIQLPSASSPAGGLLVVKHGSLKSSWLHTQLYASAVFYASCAHERTPVTTGSRLALVYELTSDEEMRFEPGDALAMQHLNTTFKLWETNISSLPESKIPQKLLIPLDHGKISVVKTNSSVD